MRIALILAVLIAFQGCTLKTMSHYMRSGDIEQHIAEHPNLSPEIKAGLNEGHAVLGMTHEQVRLALGRPQRSYTQQSSYGFTKYMVYGRYLRVLLVNDRVVGIES